MTMRPLTGGSPVPRAGGVLFEGQERSQDSSGAGGDAGDGGAAGEDEFGPGMAGREVGHLSAGVGGDRGGGGEQPQPQLLGFPSAGGVVGEAEHLGPGDQLAGQLDDRAPDAVV